MKKGQKVVKDSDNKRDDPAVVCVSATLGLTGPVNWPRFDFTQPTRSARSFVRGSFPASCGPLQAGKATLLPAFTPRNHYFTSPHELDIHHK